MRAFTLLRYGEKEEAFDAFMNHVQIKDLDVWKITTGSDELIKIIDTSIGIEELDAILAKDKHAFTKLLTKAALDGTPADEGKLADENNPVYELIKEVILMRVFLYGIVGKLAETARQVGYTGMPQYSYEKHINGKIKFDVAKLTEMRAFTHLRYGEKEEAFDAFIEHVTRTQKIWMWGK